MRIPSVPWQLTGNHWLSIPCIHPADAAIYAIGVLHGASRSVIEVAGGKDFVAGKGAPLLKPVLRVNGEVKALAAEGIAWERAYGWLPTFTCTVGSLLVRGTLFTPYGRDADMAGAAYSFTVENRGSEPLSVEICLEGVLGHRQRRVKTARTFDDLHLVSRGPDETILLEGTAVPGIVAIAVGADGPARIDCEEEPCNGPRRFGVTRALQLAAGQSDDAAFYLAAGPERDGANAICSVLRRWGWRDLLSATRTALASLELQTGDDGIDHLINRNLLFAYFCAVGRALDDAQFYPMRTRVPWHSMGCIVRDWDALMWVLPAVQLVDGSLARELLIRICELHGYAPGQGLHYYDGTLFQPGFVLEGPAAFAIAVDRYIAETGDREILEEPMISDALVLAYDDIQMRKDERLPLYSTEILPSGELSPFPFTLHGNVAVARALEFFRTAFEEDISIEVEDPEPMLRALRRHFVVGRAEQARLATSVDLAGGASFEDDSVASVLWLAYFGVFDESDAVYRRTISRAAQSTGEGSEQHTPLIPKLAQLLTPQAPSVLDWLRRAALDGGLAGEYVNADGQVVENGGDASIAGLLAWTVALAAGKWQ